MTCQHCLRPAEPPANASQAEACLAGRWMWLREGWVWLCSGEGGIVEYRRVWLCAWCAMQVTSPCEANGA